MAEEKRRFTRVPMDSRIFLEDDRGIPGAGRLIDLSVKGMQVQLDTPKSLSNRVKFQILLGGDFEPDFIIEGEAEIKRGTENGQLGLFFLGVDIESLTHLRRLVELNLGDADQAAEEIAKW
jgi:hypothetical protein